MSENCGEIRADSPADACLCYCGTCRITYAIYMLGRAILADRIVTDKQSWEDEYQTTLKLFEIER